MSFPLEDFNGSIADSSNIYSIKEFLNTQNFSVTRNFEH